MVKLKINVKYNFKLMCGRALTLLIIDSHDGSFSVFSEVLGEPDTSQHSWPTVDEEEGGAVIPCVYQIETDGEDTKELAWNCLTDLIKTAKDPDLISIVVRSHRSNLSALIHPISAQ
jgi:hypothetical protein